MEVQVRRIKEDDNNNNYNGGQTLGSILSRTRRGAAHECVQSNPTLLNIIREDSQGGSYGKDGKKNWKYFKEASPLPPRFKLFLDFIRGPTSDVPVYQNSSRFWMNMPISDTSSNMIVELSVGIGVPRRRSALLQWNATRAIDRESMRYDNWKISLFDP